MVRIRLEAVASAANKETEANKYIKQNQVSRHFYRGEQ
jgi:hypothetical protein